MMKSVIAFGFAATLSVSAFAQSAERVSAAEWVKTWAASLKSAKASAYATADLEKKLFSSCSDCINKKALEKARKDFAAGKYPQAIASYNLIPRANTYWLTAVEEKGWAFFRQGEFEKSLAQTKTLLAPQFSGVTNTEAYFLQSLTQLRLCDYKGVFETHQQFKEKQRQRILEIQELAQSGWNDSMTQFLKKADKFPLTLDDMGAAVQKLPLLIYKDIEFQKQALRFKLSERAIVAAGAQNPGLQKRLEDINDKSFRALKKRVQELAQAETNENFRIIQRLNLVEVEAIQRVHTDQSLAEESFNKKKFQKTNDDQLVFMDDGKPWIDELDKFEVAAKSCVQGIRRKM